MFDPTTLLLFVSASIALVVTPGPDLLLLTSYSSAKGIKAGIAIAVGIFAAGILQTQLVAFGLGALMQKLPVVALLVKLVGALYLAWLGIGLIRTWLKSGSHTSQPLATTRSGTLQLARLGLLNNLLNPKALIFFSLFLPQFTSEAASLTLQILVLGLLLSTIALAFNLLFSCAAAWLSNLAKRRVNAWSIGRHSDGLLGVVFLGLAARLALDR